jgi:hypothetical protein
MGKIFVTRGLLARLSNAAQSIFGIELSFLARDQAGGELAFDVSGGFTTTRTGLQRSDTLWKTLAKAAVLREGRADVPLVLLTTDAPKRGSAGHAALKVLTGPDRPVFDVVELLNTGDHDRLRDHARRGVPDR